MRKTCLYTLGCITYCIYLSGGLIRIKPISKKGPAELPHEHTPLAAFCAPGSEIFICLRNEMTDLVIAPFTTKSLTFYMYNAVV